MFSSWSTKAEQRDPSHRRLAFHRAEAQGQLHCVPATALAGAPRLTLLHRCCVFLQTEGKTFHQQKDYNLLYGSGQEPPSEISELSLFFEYMMIFK